jgi:hypothetical protein
MHGTHKNNTSTKTTQMSAFLAVDLEAYSATGIFAIGCCLFVGDRAIEHRHFTFKPKVQDFDQSTSEFWGKHTDVLQRLYQSANVASEEEMIRGFRAYFEQVVDRYPDVTIVSDNCGFDISMLSVLLVRYQLPLLVRTKEGNYRGNVHCINFAWQELDTAIPQIRAAIPHDPCADAECIGQKYSFLMNNFALKKVVAEK